MHLPGSLGTIIFLALAIFIYGGMHYVIYRNLVTAGVPMLLLRVLLFVLAVLFPLSRAITSRFQGREISWIASVSSLWLGVLVLSSMVFGASALLQTLVRFAVPHAVINRKAWALVASVLVALATVVGVFEAYRPPTVVRYAIDRTARYGQGKSVRIVHLSDLHLGVQLGEAFASRAVSMTNALSPDLIVITGDIMDSEEAAFSRVAHVLAGFRASQGVFAVSGNHDFYGGLQHFLRHMDNLGITVLNSESIRLMSGLQVAGIHDPAARYRATSSLRSDLGAAVSKMTADMPSIVLMHQPRELEPAVQANVDLVLAGHTHNGQIFPFTLFVKAAFPHIHGKYALGPVTDIIVSSGTGFWGPPMRVLTRSEIIVIDLKY